MDLLDSMKDGIGRAVREATRVRYIAEIQARLLALRLTRRARRDALVDKALYLYRANCMQHADIQPLCADLDNTDRDIDRLLAALDRARGNPLTQSSTTVTEITVP